jgi:hypothetical protein
MSIHTATIDRTMQEQIQDSNSLCLCGCEAERFQVHLLEHLHQCSVCGPVLEILDELLQQSNPVNSVEDCCDPGKMHSFHIPGGALK